MPESRISRADRRTRAFLATIGDEVRTARSMAGLTLAEAGAAAGISRSTMSRIERGQASGLTLVTLARVAAVVGLDLWLRAYPGIDPLRDQAHLVLGDAFRGAIGTSLAVRSEVRVGQGGDLRAWDMTLTDASGRRCGVEFETRFVDAQAQHRRISQKQADGGVDLVVMVVADTRANRAAVRAATSFLATSYAVNDAATYQALRSGRLPDRSALIFVAVPRRARIVSHRTGAEDARRREFPRNSHPTGESGGTSRPTKGLGG